MYVAEQLSFDDANNELKTLHHTQPQDIPRISRLPRETLKDRRQAKGELADAEVKGIIDKFPNDVNEFYPVLLVNRYW